MSVISKRTITFQKLRLPDNVSKITFIQHLCIQKSLTTISPFFDTIIAKILRVVFSLMSSAISYISFPELCSISVCAARFCYIVVFCLFVCLDIDK